VVIVTKNKLNNSHKYDDLDVDAIM